MASTECHEEYLIINSDVCLKRIAAKKYAINPIVLPMKVKIQRALKKGGLFLILLIMSHYLLLKIKCSKIMAFSIQYQQTTGLKNITFELSKFKI
jgi:hypothetical protein